MKKPDLHHAGGVFVLKWDEDDAGVSVRVDRIVESNKFEVNGELLVKTATHGHVYQGRLNMTSPTARRSFAKALTEKAPEAPWLDALEYVCVLVLAELRLGEPVRVAGQIEARETLAFRSEPLVYDGRPNLLYGDGGTGKSMIAIHIAVLVDSGYPGGFFPSVPGRVLYLDYETDAHEFRERVGMVSAGLRLDPKKSNILYRYCAQEMAADLPAIQGIVAEHHVNLIVIDSAALACGGNPEESHPTLRYFGALRTLKGVGSLTIAHQAKNALVKTPFGNVFWTNNPRTVWHIEAVQEPNQVETHVGLSHFKVNAGRKYPPIGIAMKFDQGTVLFQHRDVMDSPELAKNATIRARVQYALRRGALQFDYLLQALEAEGGPIAEASLRAFMARELDKGSKSMVAKLTNNTWGLAAKDEALL